MATGTESNWTRRRDAVLNFFHEKGIESEDTLAHSWLRRFAHLCLLVGRGFIRNRCPVRASALAYTTLLALVPLLAVAVSIATAVLQKQGEKPVAQLIDNLVKYAAPALNLEAGAQNTDGTGRDKVVGQITSFIANINSGTLGVTSALALLFVGISLLRTIEAAFNDIWGVTQGRTWARSIVYYWAAITLGPLLLAGAIALTTGPHLSRSQELLHAVPFLGAMLFRVLPFVILSLGFAAFYAFMPNTRVHWKAALAGGIVGGCLWQLNNLCNVIYVSKAASFTSIYGPLAVLPLFLVGLYFSWLIVLLGAQVAYAAQNRQAYLQEKQAGGMSQRGCEFVGLRVMTHLAARFGRGGEPPTADELAKHLDVPLRLVSRLLAAFVEGRLLLEVSGREIRYTPARPVEDINAHDVLQALRAGQGREPVTRDDAQRPGVRAQFDRILSSERAASAPVTLALLAGLRGEAGRARP